MQESKFLIHGNGKEKPPTGFMFEKELMKGLYFNQSPTKVCGFKSVPNLFVVIYTLSTPQSSDLVLLLKAAPLGYNQILELKTFFLI